MAVFNELQVGRYNRLSQKLFSMKGSAAVNSLVQELALTLAVFHGVENRYLESWSRFAQFIQQSAVAAASTSIRLRNPAGSNVVAVVEKLLINNPNAGTITPTMSMGAVNTDLATVPALTTARLDPRGVTNPTCVASSTTGVASGTSTGKIAFTLSTLSNLDVVWFEEQEITILPGDSLNVLTTEVNVTLNVSFVWRERFLEDSERA